MACVNLNNMGASLRSACKKDPKTFAILVAGAIVSFLPLETTHLLSMLVGALGYLALQALQPKVQRKTACGKLSAAEAGGASRGACSQKGPRRQAAPPLHSSRGPRNTAPVEVQPTPKLDVRKPSVAPVQAPVFAAAGWEAEVQELLSRIAPTPESDAAVATITRAVQRAIRPILPEVQVVGFASGNPLSGTAFGVAVPEVDVVISVSPSAAKARAPSSGRSCCAGSKLDARKLQKSAIRSCTDRLVATGLFKFRRSAFRGHEPKVTLVALVPGATRATTSAPGDESPPQMGGIPINVSVNAVTPLHCAALLTECGQIDPRAKSLILLVRRWAKDRGLSHAAKGHLSPYCWTLLTIFYLQAGLEAEEGGPLLPALDGFTASAALAAGQTCTAAPPAARKIPASTSSCTKQVGELFMGFAHFYATRFDWRKEAVSVRLGKRSPPEVALPLHIVLHDDSNTTEVGPSIEDPFDTSCNLGTCTTAVTLGRLREELGRLRELCGRSASLSELLEPWAPPEVDGAGAAEDEEMAEG